MKIIVNSSKLYRKMLVCSRLNLKCDDVNIRLCYTSNEYGKGWIIENFYDDGRMVWLKGKKTEEVVKMITEKYNVINITWSRRNYILD